MLSLYLSPARRYPLTEADHRQFKYQHNIGVSAHIDAGKTMLMERFYHIGADMRYTRGVFSHFVNILFCVRRDEYPCGKF